MGLFFFLEKRMILFHMLSHYSYVNDKREMSMRLRWKKKFFPKIKKKMKQHKQQPTDSSFKHFVISLICSVRHKMTFRAYVYACSYVCKFLSVSFISHHFLRSKLKQRVATVINRTHQQAFKYLISRIYELLFNETNVYMIFMRLFY